MAFCFLLGLFVYSTASVQAAGLNGYAIPISFTNFAGRGTLTNFPVLVKLDAVNTGGYKGFLDTANGFDLRFWDNDSPRTELNYEIESFNTNGTSCIWVQVPLLTHNTSIWANWGDPEQTSQPPYTTNGAVWSAGYKVVYHLNTDSADSTATGLDAVAENGVGTGVAGVAANGIDLGGGAHLDLGASGWGFMCGSGTNFTLSAWVNLDSNNADGILFARWEGKGNDRWKFWSDTGDGVKNYAFNSQNGNKTTSVTNGCLSIVGTWQYVVATDNRGTVRVYVDAGTPNTVSGINLPTSTASVSVGTENGDSTVNPLNGQVDEVRISTVARSADWIWAEYMNQGPNHEQFSEYGSVTRTPPGTVLVVH